MKAVMQVEIHCGECNSLMQYHKESTMVRCNQLKCKERLVEYLAPSLDLQKPGTLTQLEGENVQIAEDGLPMTAYGVREQNEMFWAELEASIENGVRELQDQMIAPLISQVEVLIEANKYKGAKRGPKPKQATQD